MKTVMPARAFRAPPPRADTARDATPTFSVVIAAHNAAKSLGEALESALAQTLPPLEVIVVDNGSTDATGAVLNRYRNRVTCLRKERGGVAAARNLALEAAKGDFFAVLDADDVYAPTRLEALAELAVARPDLDILCTDVLLEAGGRIAERFTDTTPFPVENQRAAILERCFCAAPALRRSSLAAIGGYDESLETGSDWECLIRLLYSGANAGLVEEPLYHYRIRADSLTGDRLRTLRDRVALLEGLAAAYELGLAERLTLERSVATQRATLALTEAEAALRAQSPDARKRALAAARVAHVPLHSRAGALAAVLAPKTAARVLERRARAGRTRLTRSAP
jgi:glycosyltransferase involved in cell wall biosynthesis